MHPTDEEELEAEGYTLLELDGVSNIWYKTLPSGVTRYFQQDEISHHRSYYLDVYFYIEVDTSNNASLIMKTRTETDSLIEGFVPEYVIFQNMDQHSTSNEGKITLIYGDTLYDSYYSYSTYYVWCDSTVMNDSDTTLNNLIEFLDTEEYVYFYFATDYRQTYLKALSSDFQQRIRDTLYTYVNYKDELTYRE